MLNLRLAREAVGLLARATWAREGAVRTHPEVPPFFARLLSTGSKTPPQGHHKDRSHPARPPIRSSELPGEAKRVHEEVAPSQPSAPAAPPGKRGDPRRLANGAIRADWVRLVSPRGEHSVVRLVDALHEAARASMDLVQVSRTQETKDGTLAVCKLQPHGAAAAPAAAAAAPGARPAAGAAPGGAGRARGRAADAAKEMRFSPGIAEHDIAVKMRKVAGFLAGGKTVKLSVQFRLPHPSKGEEAREAVRRGARELIQSLVGRHEVQEGGKATGAPQYGRGEIYVSLAPRAAPAPRAPG